MMNSLTPRERVLTALNLKEPDRVPIDVGGCSTTTIIGDAYERIKDSLGVTGETLYMKRKSRSVLLDEVVAQRLHTDTRAVMVGGPDDWEDIYFEDGSFKDEFGVIWRKAEGGHYNPLGNPLSNASIGEITTYQWPDPFNPGRTRGLRAIAKKLHEETDYAVVLTLPSGFVHLSTYLRGFENFLVDFAWDQKFLEALLDRTLEFFLGLTDAVMEAVDPYVDVVMYGDDVAFQNGPMVDLSRYRKIIKPRHKKIFENIKNKSRAKILYHCCGSVRTLLDDFIDMGIDALNPVQVLCTGMETSELKAEFGGRVCFWGAIDTQSVLPLGSPDDVRKEVRKRINDLAPGGGYVLASVHNIQEDVSLDNILAMVDTAFEVG